MPALGTERLYTRQFFEVFAAVTLFMGGFALQFHFGQYVEFVGGQVDTLGRILSLSMLGTLAVRFHIGRWVDRFGCKPIWLWGTTVVALTFGLIQFTRDLWLITLLRTINMVAFAAVMTTVAVFAAMIAPPRRRAESLGTLGLAGFTGMLLGPTLGDWIFAGGVDSITPYRVFFSASAACSLLAGAIMALVKLPEGGGTLAQPGDTHRSAAAPCPTEKEPLGAAPASRAADPIRPCDTVLAGALPEAAAPPAAPPITDGETLRVILAHWPGPALLISVVMGMVFCLNVTFIERLAEARAFYDIKLFFIVYAPTAMTLRIALRRLPERLGRTRTVILGMTLMAAGVFLLAGAQSQAGLIVPGLLMGGGHCFVFPSMVDLGASALPPTQRGAGTSLVMGAGDVGMLIGFAALGEAIDVFGYTLALRVLAAVALAGVVVFALGQRRRRAAHQARVAPGQRRATAAT